MDDGRHMHHVDMSPIIHWTTLYLPSALSLLKSFRHDVHFIEHISSKYKLFILHEIYSMYWLKGIQGSSDAQKVFRIIEGDDWTS